MPGESFIQLPPNSTGLKSHTFQRLVGANNVEDEVVILGEPYLATYGVPTGGTSIASSGAHLLQIVAGASLKVRIQRIEMVQEAVVAAAGTIYVQVVRLTSAGTGGTAITPSPFDTADAAAGATAQTLPSSKGTEGAILHAFEIPVVQTAPKSVPSYVWTPPVGTKPFVIPAGATNGIAIKLGGSIGTMTGGTVQMSVVFTESSF